VNTEFQRINWVDVGTYAENTRMMIEAFRAALAENPDIIVFPETARALTRFGGKEHVFKYIRSVTDHDVIVIDSDSVTDDAGKTYVRALLYDTSTEKVYDVHKQFLTPSGEYVPYHFAAVLSLFGPESGLESAQRVMKFSTGMQKNDLRSTKLPGVLFCSENISPLLTLKISQGSGVRLLVHPVSHAWFHSPHTFWHQQDLVLRTQSRMTRTPIVRAANMWEPGAYDAFGQPIQGETVFSNASTSVVVYEL
jgi:apolipoprotein N-acyltransferase